MALEHAILVSLAEKSASGYDLARRFDKSIGHFWKASHQQIYKVVARMEADTWVVSEVVVQDARPDRRVYSITVEGRAELLRWSRQPAEIEPLRSAYAVKMRGLSFVDRDALIADVRRRRAAHRSLLDSYRADAVQNFADPRALSDERLGPYLVLRGGIRLAEGEIAWCDEALSVLERR